MTATARASRVESQDWKTLAGEMNDFGCAVTGPIVTLSECEELLAIYGAAERFRKTINMDRHGYGSGSYQYFAYPLPEIVEDLRRAFYPYLLPLAREWAEKLRWS